MTDDYCMWDQASWTDPDEQNKRLADMDVPDYTLKPSPRAHPSGPRFSEWYRLPESKRPPKIEGKKRVYNVTAMYRNEFIDGLGNNVEQIQATINGRNIIVNSYDDGRYVVSNGKHAYKATDDNLDDVIDGVVS